MSGDAWEKFAQDDAYWAVLTEDRFKGGLDAAGREAFFRTGSKHVKQNLDRIATHFDRRIGADDSAIDFGCGVGRLTVPMARICRLVAGIDVSETMREECLRNARSRRLRNIDCYDGPAALEGEARFDWLNSFIVFQHIETRLGYRLFEMLLKLIRVRGVVSVHFTLFKDERHSHYFGNGLKYFSVDENGVRDYVSDGPYYNDDAMMMNDYRLDRLVALLYANGFRRHFIEMEDQDGMHGATIYSIKDD